MHGKLRVGAKTSVSGKMTTQDAWYVSTFDIDIDIDIDFDFDLI